MELNPPLKGNRVTVLVEEMEGGNYSCHLSPGGQYLNHTVIFIQLDSEKRLILKKSSPEEGRFRETECVMCVCMCVKAVVVLKAPLFPQGTSTALHPTTPARFTVPGQEQTPDPTLLCCYYRLHGNSFVLCSSKLSVL